MKNVDEQKKKLEQKKSRLAIEETRLKLKERKMRTRHLIEVGGLVVKAKIDNLKWLYFRGQILYKDFNLKKYYYDKKKEFLFARI